MVKTIRYPNAEYDGEWLAGVAHGQGMYKSADGGVYDGEWCVGSPHGKGIYKWTNGDVYDGEFKVGKRNGKGIYKWANGDVYDGKWKQNERHGEGKMKSKYGSEYDGEWFIGKRQGVGIQTRLWNIYRYQGEWNNDKKHGKGTVALLWSFLECQGKWEEGWLRGMPICRSALFQRLIKVTWHYLVEHYLDLVAVLKVWIGLWAFRRELRRELADVKATLSKFEAHMKEKLKNDARGDNEVLVVGLDQDHIQCGICHEAFTTDMQTTDQTTREMLPVLGSCGHYFCHGCIIRWRSNCPKCMKANQFVPGNPTHHRMLIDLLQRARPVSTNFVRSWTALLKQHILEAQPTDDRLFKERR
jgi:hypothetical protein